MSLQPVPREMLQPTTLTVELHDEHVLRKQREDELNQMLMDWEDEEFANYYPEGL